MVICDIIWEDGVVNEINEERASDSGRGVDRSGRFLFLQFEFERRLGERHFFADSGEDEVFGNRIIGESLLQ